MARIRSIRPEFWTRHALASAPHVTRLVMLGLMQFADDEGRLGGNPTILCAQIFPAGGATPDEVSAALAYLAACKPAEIIRYSVNDTPYIALPGYREKISWQYQQINKPVPSQIPDRRRKRSGTTPGGLREDSGSATGGLPAGVEGSGVDRKGKEPPYPPNAGGDGGWSSPSAPNGEPHGEVEDVRPDELTPNEVVALRVILDKRASLGDGAASAARKRLRDQVLPADAGRRWLDEYQNRDEYRQAILGALKIRRETARSA